MKLPALSAVGSSPLETPGMFFTPTADLWAKLMDRLGYARFATQGGDIGFMGLKDFAAFCKRREGATTVRTLMEFSWTRGAEGAVEARVVADAFCHSMVRSLVGAIVPVGEGRRPIEWPRDVLRQPSGGWSR